MSTPYVVPFRADLFAGKRALVTGGGTGLGRAVAHRIAQLGGRVVICGRREEIIQATAAEISAATGSEVTSLRCDIRDAATVDGMFTEIWNSGPLDILVRALKQWNVIFEEIPRRRIWIEILIEFLVIRIELRDIMMERLRVEHRLGGRVAGRRTRHGDD